VKRLLLIAMLVVPLAGCGEKASEPTPPPKSLPKEAGNQQLSYTGGK
jgi:predicted small lipoprotein YifL